MTEIQPDDVLWCMRTFQMMSLGGVWGVPRSGLIFRKESLDPPTLKLETAKIARHTRPIGDKAFKEFQRQDLAEIRRYFKAAGITVEGEIE